MKLGKALGVAISTSLLFVGMSAATANATSTVPSFKNRWSGQCLGVGSSTSNGAPVIQWGCNGAADEQWYLWQTSASDGSIAYYVKNRYSGKCLGVGSSLASGAGVIQYTCNEATDEMWWVEDEEMQNVYSGKCIGTGGNGYPGNQVIQWPCNGEYDEKWMKRYF